MKIFATGDTHWNFERFRPEYFPEGQELTKKDVVLQLGDFVGVWFGDKRDDDPAANRTAGGGIVP